MKNKTLFALALGTLLAVTGCKSPERFTKLDQGSSLSGGTRKSPDLNTAPIGIGDASQVAETTALGPDDFGLANEDGLADRELDRSEFAAQTIHFDYDQSSVKSSEAGKIDEVVSALRAKGTGYDLLVEGHCDERGTEEYNRALGERRALAIRELLVAAGVPADRVHTVSFGKDKPLDPGRSESAYSKNRRGEFILVLPK